MSEHNKVRPVMYPPIATPGATEPLLQESDYSTNRPFFSYTGWVLPRRHRRLFTLCAVLAVITLSGVLFRSQSGVSFSRLAPDLEYPVNKVDPLPHPFEQGSETRPSEPPTSPPEIDPLDSRSFLRGPPTRKFRDNLLPHLKYISSWIAAGWTNDVITYMNLIYLGLITDRIPIIPLFNPSHVHDAPSIAFSDIFDVPRLRNAIGMPILDWDDVKDSKNGDLEIIGCWNVWESIQKDDHHPRYSVSPHQLHLDISYTRTPAWIKMIPNFQHDKYTPFWSLASLAFPETRKASLIPPLASPERRVLLPPDEHLLCFDFLFYASADQPNEFEFDYGPAWRYVGQHMRWTPALERLGEQAIRRTLGVRDGDTLPYWITVHVRHRDFADWCRGVPIFDCFATIPVIARRVQDVKDELYERRGIKVDHVIMTSDENNATWWQEVVEQGWKRVDYSNSENLYGGWDPLFTDVVIQSNGIGFVATDLSTVSVLARRRVETWNNGIAKTVRWGNPHSDDH